MKFRTEISIHPSPVKISHNDKVMLFGSCFAESIGNKLSYHKFPAMTNPCGIMFNPVSIYNAFRFICEKKVFTESDIFFNDGLWHSFFHHGLFSNRDKTGCLNTINQSIGEAYDFVKNAATVVITLGTAYVWEYLQNGIVVTNCHKMPSSAFNQYMLSVEQVQESLFLIIEHLKKVNNKATVIFTVSPVRYLKNGDHNNQLSKATLLLAIDNLRQQNKTVEYFPSYEIMMDDLRDYRFYADDLIHPSSKAIDYIWEKFSECYFDATTIELNKKIGAYQKALSHTVLHEHSASQDAFLDHISALRKSLQHTNPHLQL